MKYMLKLTIKSIQNRIGRYITIFLIIFLSVAFFSGLKITKPAMLGTCNDFLNKQQMFDYQLLSSTGFTDTDLEIFENEPIISDIEGGKSYDVMLLNDYIEAPYKIIKMPDTINMPSIKYGRMPEEDNECLADVKLFDESDIGKKLSIMSAPLDLKIKEFTITGIADSPIYMGNDRGTTNLGSGHLEGYIYVMPESFYSDIYTELWIRLDQSEDAYSTAYKDIIKEQKEHIASLVPNAYVLTREENPGYVSFKNDTSIISGIANIFPFFFAIIAMLICITSMTRMIEEERSLIGILKALGYADYKIKLKYIIYAASAATLGWISGFIVGTWGLPKVFWFAYSSLYDFSALKYYFSMPIALGTFLVVFLGILVSTFIACQNILHEKPAQLIRPKVPKNGARIFLERFGILWNRIPFLGKIALRNMVRYKSRLILMLIGISCSCALVVTAFGVKDSMINIGTEQFTNIQTYDMEVYFADENCKDVESLLNETKGILDYKTLMREDVKIESVDGEHIQTQLMIADSLDTFWNFLSDGVKIEMPKDGEIIICNKLAETLNVSIGDTISIDIDGKEFDVIVSGIFENYLNKYALITPKTLEKIDLPYEKNLALLDTEKTTEELVEKLSDEEMIIGITELEPIKDTADQALNCLNYIIWVIVLFSGALAFTVIYNLTSINLAERSREIATVQVLGFYPKETESYVLRENILLSVIAAVIGLPIGTMLHSVVMSMIKIDVMSFRQVILSTSYVAAVICTILFALIVNCFMKHHIKKINMAESLKAVE